MTTQATAEPIRLDYRVRSGAQVVITPRDEDRFVLSIRDAAEACARGRDMVRFEQRLRQVVLPRLAQWLRKHDDEISAAYLTVRDGGMLFVVVRKAARYDADFADALTDLDTEMAAEPQADLVPLEVLALPNVTREGAESFLNPEWTMEFTRGKQD
jgi:hypothetical protein